MARRRIQHLLFIVGRERRPLYDSLRRTFARDDTVQIVLDRRVRDRRRCTPPQGAPERRRDERRAQREIDTQLSARGYAVVGVLTFQRPPASTPEPAERKAR